MSIQDKIVYTKSFNTLFLRFIDYVLQYLPETDYKKEVKTARTYFEWLKNVNPSLIIKVWYYQVYMPYKNEINSQNTISFMLKKDYQKDVADLGNAKDIIQIINHLKGPLESMNKSQQDQIMDYLQKLSALSESYSMI